MDADGDGGGMCHKRYRYCSRWLGRERTGRIVCMQEAMTRHLTKNRIATKENHIVLRSNEIMGAVELPVRLMFGPGVCHIDRGELATTFLWTNMD